MLRLLPLLLTISIIATWYCLPGISACIVGYNPNGMYAAANPKVAKKGDRLKVCARGHCIRVKIIDTCARKMCLDLYAHSFRQLAPLSRGLIKVTITKIR